MVELQEPTDLMVVSEKTTPSGREIPQSKIDMGLGRKRMFELYDYTGFPYDELQRRFMPEQVEILPNVYEILGKRITNKFSMYKLVSRGEFVPGKKYVVAIVCNGKGRLCNTQVKKGERLLMVGERSIVFEGDLTFEIIICF